MFAAFLIFVALSGCDSNNNDNAIATEFRVRYEVIGSCDVVAVVGYTVNGGGADGASVTIPWSVELDINAPTPFTAVSLGAVCAGQGATNTITAKIFVDGDERGSRTDSGTGILDINVTITLN